MKKHHFWHRTEDAFIEGIRFTVCKSCGRTIIWTSIDPYFGSEGYVLTTEGIKEGLKKLLTPEGVEQFNQKFGRLLGVKP